MQTNTIFTFWGVTKWNTTIPLGNVTLGYDSIEDLATPLQIGFENVDGEIKIVVLDILNKKISIPDDIDLIYTQLPNEIEPFHVWYPNAHLIEVSKFHLGEYSFTPELVVGIQNALDEMMRIIGEKSNPIHFIVLSKFGAVSAFESCKQTIIQLGYRKGPNDDIIIDTTKTILIDLSNVDLLGDFTSMYKQN